ncbi:acyl-CoA thioesterase [Phaeovibrio sulfidiphilus]|uniref:Acyl-CoA thioesterase n=2 Tax=Phaeovibrio sulfidiphilus TaxID=1220600 RepID=A0A8J7CQ04_9PROT|nr:acyl-CoA thioesterase [Phaeovibrio sulfidiphilus]
MYDEAVIRPGGARGHLAIRQVAMPANTNQNGDIFGGWIMSQMDVGGGVYARLVTGGRVVTVAVEALTFHKPVQVGDEVSVYCSVVRKGRTSITIHVQTWVRRYPGVKSWSGTNRTDPAEYGKFFLVTEGNFVFVRVDDGGNPIPFPQ